MYVKFCHIFQNLKLWNLFVCWEYVYLAITYHPLYFLFSIIFNSFFKCIGNYWNFNVFYFFYFQFCEIKQMCFYAVLQLFDLDFHFLLLKVSWSMFNILCPMLLFCFGIIMKNFLFMFSDEEKLIDIIIQNDMRIVVVFFFYVNIFLFYKIDEVCFF